MSTTGRDFEGALDVLLTFYIVKINLICGVPRKERVDVNNGRVEWPLTVEQQKGFTQCRHAENRNFIDNRGLGRVFPWAQSIP